MDYNSAMNDNYTCKYCNKTIPRKDKYTECAHLFSCIKFISWKEQNLTYDNLYKLYIEQKMSLPEIRDHFGLKTCSTIYGLLKKFNIPIRTIKESSPERIKKASKTNIEKYGCANVLGKESIIRKKVVEDLYEKYGVTNVFELDFVKEKIKQYWQTNYGVDAGSQVTEIREKQIASFQKKYGLSSPLQLVDMSKSKFRTSSIHKKVYNFLHSHGIDCYNELFVQDQDNPRKYCWFDIYFKNNELSKLLLEINGDHVHANPKFYKENDLLNIIYKKRICAKEIWEHDLNKKKFAESLDYTVYYIWEDDIRHNFLQVKNNLIELIKGYYEEGKDPFNKKT